MGKQEMIEKMFENLHDTLNENVECMCWWNGNLIKIEGILSTVSDYDKVCINGIYLPFIDYGKAIFYVRSENGMLYLNPTVKDGYEVKPDYYVNQMRKAFFGEEKSFELER
mgnify:CR=1 FL=1